MKTMSISKIALALLISVPALTLNGASTLTATCSAPVSLLGRLGEMTKKGCEALWAKTKLAVNDSIAFVQKNPKTFAKGAGIATAATLGAYGLYKGYNWIQNKWFAPKKAAQAVVAPAAKPRLGANGKPVPATPQYSRIVAGPVIDKYSRQKRG